MDRLRAVQWGAVRRDAHNTVAKLLRTRRPDPEPGADATHKLTRCLTTLDLASLGVGSCAGTGMYLVSGLVANRAGPAVALSFLVAATASLFSGACYAEFGVRVPHTTGSAYTYAYVTVGEFLAFVIGWNMVLEYLIGTSACARALSACFDSLCDGTISRHLADNLGTIYGKPPDVLACAISIGMTLVLLGGVKKSLLFNNLLNAINLSAFAFIIGAGLFYVDSDNWTEHGGFMPKGWSGVLSGAATCFYAFIGFDIIATTGEEAQNPRRSIPLAVVWSLGAALTAYVVASLLLTLVVPYEQVAPAAGLVEMFAFVRAPMCHRVAALGALAGLTVSMFGSMFPMPRVIYAMAKDGLIFKQLAAVSLSSGVPAVATAVGGVAAALLALLVQLEVLVEMMSIGTLLAYTLVSGCVLVLRYQPHPTTLVELLPRSLRTPLAATPPHTPSATTTLSTTTHMMPPGQRVMVRRVTRSSPDSDETMGGEEAEDDAFLINAHAENKFYGAVGGGSGNGSSAGSRLLAAVCRRARDAAYLCPGLLPWVDPQPATYHSGMAVVKLTGALLTLVVVVDMVAAWGSGAAVAPFVVLLLIAILAVLLLISRKPQNKEALMYATPGVPFVPGTAILVNVYLILNLSVLTLVRFTVWMTLGLIMYFKYGIKNSKLETEPAQEETNETAACSLVIPPRPERDRNIFEGDGNAGLYANDQFPDPLIAWPDAALSSGGPYKQVESRYDAKTNSTSSHASSRPAWACPDPPPAFPTWDD